MNREQLRKEILRKRDSLEVAKLQEHGQQVLDRLVAMKEYQAAQTLFLYVSFRSELPTLLLLEHILASGKRAVVPVTLVAEKDLLPVLITDPATELLPGYCSIPEPVMAIRDKKSIAAEEIDIILLPGSVFDERGGRMGYGGGYYDRFVSKRAPQALRIGLCHDLQVVDKAPLQEHDELLDYIVTEQRLLTGVRTK